VRLFPIPFDVRCDRQGADNVFPPFIDAQVNLPLFVLVTGAVCAVAARLGWWRRAGLALALAPAALVCVATLMLSISPALTSWMPAALCKVQFAYRLVSVVNLSALLCLLIALPRAGQVTAGLERRRLGVPAALTSAVMTLAVVGLMVKLTHASVLPSPTLPRSRPEVRDWTTHFQFATSAAYLTPHWLAPLPAEDHKRLSPVKFEVDWDRCFGRPLPASVTLQRDGYCATRVMPFPWGRFWIDGKEVPPDRLRSYFASPAGAPPTNWDMRVAVPMSAGAHTISYDFVPDRTWRRLDRASTWLLAAWLAFTGAASLASAVTWRQRKSPVAWSAPPAGASQAA
jgi:hypothetical protein